MIASGRKENQPVQDYRRTGWLVYISDINGNLCSPVALAIKQQITSDYNLYFETQIGGAFPDGTVDLNKFPGWPLPVNGNGSNYRELKEYMEDHGQQVIIDIFGQQVYDMCQANLDNYYLVCETVSWHGVPGKSYNGAGNHWGWVKLWESGGA